MSKKTDLTSWHSLFGKMTDREIALKANVSVSTVNQARLKLKIPAFKPHKLTRLETAEMIKPYLGKDSDWNVGNKFGLSQTYVGKLRTALGIPPFGGKRGGRPYSKNPKPIIKTTTRGRPNQIDYERVLPFLGKVPDSKLADIVGCSRESLRLKREELGIPKCDLIKYTTHHSLPKKPELFEDLKKDLKTLPKKKILEKWKVSETNLSHWRNELQIHDIVPGYESKEIPEGFSKAYYEMPVWKVAKKYDVSPMTIYRWVRKLKLPHKAPSKNHGGKTARPIPSTFIDDFYTMSNSALQVKYDISSSTIYEWQKRLKIPKKQRKNVTA